MSKKYMALFGAFLTAMSMGLAQPMDVVEAAAEPTKVVAPKAPFVYKKDSPSWQAFCQKYKLNPEVQGKRVIVDMDLTYLNDDCFTLFELLKLHQYGFIKLEGLSMVGANTLVAGATYDTLSVLDELGIRDIPVYMGTDKPLKGFKKSQKIVDEIGEMGYMGAYMKMDKYTKDYKLAMEKGLATTYLDAPTLDPEEKDSAKFLVDAVKEHPGEVIVVALGGLMNVAKAIKMDKTFAENAAGIVYMGGVFDVPGEVIDNLEINWWFDPTAVNICLQAPWKKQLIVPHDAATTCLKDDTFLSKYDGKNNSKIVEMIKRDLPRLYKERPYENLHYFWDPITVAVMACPDIITKAEVRDIAVEDKWGYGYANTFTWKAGKGPKNVGQGEVVLAIDGNLFYDFVTDLHALED